jgi:hypothetical protein
MGAGLILELVPGKDMTFRRRGYFERGSEGLPIFDATADIEASLRTIILI